MCELLVEKRSPSLWVSSGARPVVERTGLYRLLTDLVSTWINLQSPTQVAVAPEALDPGVAHLPQEIDPLDCFGSVVALAGEPCPGCASSTLLSLGVRGGGQVLSYVHADSEGSRLMPYHLAERVVEVPDEGRARPVGIVLGSVTGELGVPDHVARLLWAGQDGRPVGWTRVRRDPAGACHPALLQPSRGWFVFDRSIELSLSHRLLWLDPEDSRDCELLLCDLREGYDAAVVRRLHSFEAEALHDLELIP